MRGFRILNWKLQNTVRALDESARSCKRPARTFIPHHHRSGFEGALRHVTRSGASPGQSDDVPCAFASTPASGLRAEGLLNQCNIESAGRPPPPKRFRKRGEPRAEPPICDPSGAGGCQFNSPALGLAPALFARARLAAGCRNDSGAGATPALNAAIPWKAYAANGPGNYCDFEAFPGRSPPARPPTLLVSASPPGW